LNFIVSVNITKAAVVGRQSRYPRELPPI